MVQLARLLVFLNFPANSCRADKQAKQRHAHRQINSDTVHIGRLVLICMPASPVQTSSNICSESLCCTAQRTQSCMCIQPIVTELTYQPLANTTALPGWGHDDSKLPCRPIHCFSCTVGPPWYWHRGRICRCHDNKRAASRLVHSTLPCILCLVCR